jgi:hypothetical protein
MLNYQTCVCPPREGQRRGRRWLRPGRARSPFENALVAARASSSALAKESSSKFFTGQKIVN